MVFPCATPLFFSLYSQFRARKESHTLKTILSLKVVSVTTADIVHCMLTMYVLYTHGPNGLLYP